MERLEATFKVVTPLFIGGAHTLDEKSGATHIKADIRVPSIKGALRYWYRAADPEYRSNESRVFGATGEKAGQSSFLLRVAGGEPRTEIWVRHWEARGYDRAFREGDGKFASNGLMYYGFPLTMGKPPADREFIAPGVTFKVEAVFRGHPSAEDQRRVLAAFWLLGHVGGLGFRSRRAYGTVALQSWSVEGGDWSEMAGLPLAHGAKTPEEWMQQFEQALRTLRAWFPSPQSEPDHLILSGARFVLRRDDRRAGPRGGSSFDAWAHSMDAAGKLMQRFRQRRPPEDYASVKAYLVKVLRLDSARAGVNPGALRVAPQRVRFGLPLTIRYSSLRDLNGGRDPVITLQGANSGHDRSGSPVWVRIVEIGDQCYPLFGVFPAPLLPAGEKVGTGRSGSDAFDAPGRDILDRFVEHLLNAGAPAAGGAPVGLEAKA